MVKAIEIAYQKGWRKLWLECDSILVVQAFKSDKLVPWQRKNRGLNVVAMSKSMVFIVGHIYCEGNTCAYRLASHNINLQKFCWWEFTPTFVSRFFLFWSNKIYLVTGLASPSFDLFGFGFAPPHPMVSYFYSCSLNGFRLVVIGGLLQWCKHSWDDC